MGRFAQSQEIDCSILNTLRPNNENQLRGIPDSVFFANAIQLGHCWISSYPNNANQFADECVLRAYSLNIPANVDFILDMAEVLFINEQDSLSELCIEEALHMAEPHDSTNWKAEVYLFASKLKQENNERYSAMPFLDSALANINKPDPELRAVILMNLGRLYYDLGDYSTAMKQYAVARDVYESNGLKSMDYGNLLHYIGSVFKRQYNDSTAAEYYQKMVDLGKEIDEPLLEAEGYYLLSDIYGYAGDFENEMKTLKIALDLYEQYGDERGIVQVQLAIAHAYVYSGDDDLAIEYSLKALERNKGASTTISFNALRYLGRMYGRKGDFRRAQDYFAQAMEVARSTEEKRLINLRNLQYNIAFTYVKEMDWKSAFYALEKYISYQDTLVRKENRNVVNELEQRYEKEKKDAEIVLLNKDTEIKKKEIARQKLVKYAFMGGFTLMLMLAASIFFSLQQNKRKNKIITAQKEQVEHKNEEIMASITYAKKLQTAVLPPARVVKEYFADSFLLYLPRDIVSGDFYWMEHLPLTPSSKEGGTISYFAVADCTGHGVPGAMLSVIGMNGLNRALNEQKLTEPKDILTSLSDHVQRHFEQSESTVRDGMDICLCALDDKTKKLTFSGANNPVWIARNGEMHILNGDRRAIGHHNTDTQFTQQEFQLQDGDVIYLSSDGYQDQLGGPKARKLMKKVFREKLLALSKEPLDKQRETLLSDLETWKGTQNQTDDICVMGIRV